MAQVVHDEVFKVVRYALKTDFFVVLRHIRSHLGRQPAQDIDCPTNLVVPEVRHCSLNASFLRWGQLDRFFVFVLVADDRRNVLGADSGCRRSGLGRQMFAFRQFCTNLTECV